jgi:hypothetical protein
MQVFLDDEFTHFRDADSFELDVNRLAFDLQTL